MYSHHARAWHKDYEEAHPAVKEAIDEAYTAARAVLAEHGMAIANDDRAETLVAAIMEYVTESTV